MNISPRLLLASGVLALAALPVSAKIQRTVEKTFTVQPGGTLKVSTQGGNIKVEPSDDSVVKVIARENIRASSDAEADEVLKKLTLTIEQHGNDVTAESSYEKQSFGLHVGSWPPVEVSFVVTVPTRFAAVAKTSGGDIEIGDLDGTVNARTSGGEIKLGKIGGEVDAETSGGNVGLNEGRASVKLATSGGDVALGHAVGAADLHTSGGNIRVDLVENTLSARTSGGNVRATIGGPLKGDCVLSTSGGNVRVTVDKTAAFELDASTSGGDVDASGLTLTISKGGQGRSSLAGAVNGGGSRLKLRSSGGNIEIRTR
jgi:DUF4097 and DUF4098 domain-containing protein YvlB